MDEIFKNFADVSAEFTLKYNKFYIGLSKDGVARNFISFRPKKNYIWLHLKCSQTDESNDSLNSTELEWNYDNRWKQYSIRINRLKDYTDSKTLIDSIIVHARNHYNI